MDIQNRHKTVSFPILGALAVLAMAQPAAAQKRPTQADPMSLELLRAVKVADVDAAKVALKHGANPNCRDDKGDTPLVLAAETGSAPLVKLLVTSGALLTQRTTYGRLASVEAAAKGNLEALKELLPIKWDGKHSDSFGKTPLIAAAEAGHLSVVMALIGSKAPVDTAQKTGATALMAAAGRGSDDIVRALIAAKAKPDMVDQFGRSAPFYAAVNGHASTLELTLSAMTKPLRPDAEGSTILAATIASFLTLPPAEIERRMPILARLATAKVPLNHTDLQGRTALFAPAERGNLMLVKFLVERGIALGKRDASNSTALTWAIRERHQEVIEYLRSKGSPE